MPKDAADTTLYRLIEAGQLARRALLAPVVARGLESGDDALLFAVSGAAGESVAGLSELTGLDPGALGARAGRLAARGLMQPVTIGEALAPGWALTAEGLALRAQLAEHWRTLEEALFADLDKKQRKTLRKALGRFADLLAP